MNEEEKERLIKKDILSVENRVRHAFNQGYEMGLKERKNTCEDAISRAEAIKAMNDLEQEDIERYGCHIPEGFDGERAIEVLQSLPSVNPQYTDAEIQKMQELEQAEIQKAYELGKAVQPKTGHWIYDRTRDWDGECKYECSECGMGSDVDYPYCMRCGAKMVEPREEEG